MLGAYIKYRSVFDYMTIFIIYIRRIFQSVRLICDLFLKLVVDSKVFLAKVICILRTATFYQNYNTCNYEIAFHKSTTLFSN